MQSSRPYALMADPQPFAVLSFAKTITLGRQGLRLHPRDLKEAFEELHRNITDETLEKFFHNSGERATLAHRANAGREICAATGTYFRLKFDTPK